MNVDHVGHWKVPPECEWLGIGRGTFHSEETWAQNRMLELIDSPRETLASWERGDYSFEHPYITTDELGQMTVFVSGNSAIETPAETRVVLSVSNAQMDVKLAVLDEWMLSDIIDRGIEYPFDPSKPRVAAGRTLVAEFHRPGGVESLAEDAKLYVPYTAKKDDYDSGVAVLQ